MKKLKYLLLVIILLLTVNVKAEDRCDKTELARLKELANKVEFDYEYELIDEKAVFKINAVNLNEDLKVLIIEDYYNDKYQEFKDNSTHKATINNFEPGKKVTITIKGYVPNWCSGKTIATKTVKLPYYNYFYDEEKCKGHEDFKYCKLLIDSNITQSEFDRQYELYLKNKNKEEVQPVKEPEDNNELYMIIGISVAAVIVLVVIVSIIVKKRKKNRL